MKHVAHKLSLAVFCSFIAAPSLTAELSETITASASTEYCVDQTSVRGDFDNLVIDHNLLIPSEHHFSTGDIFVGARFKSRPNELWLLSGIRWRKINNDADIINAQHKHFEQLPMVVPISVFYEPMDVSSAIGNGEIWIGYGLRGATETTQVSFEDMRVNKRFSLLWEALPPPYIPATGVREPTAVLCWNTKEVTKTLLTAQLAKSQMQQTATRKEPDILPNTPSLATESLVTP